MRDVPKRKVEAAVAPLQTPWDDAKLRQFRWLSRLDLKPAGLNYGTRKHQQLLSRAGPLYVKLSARRIFIFGRDL
jgi:hypothetical protein